MGVSLPALLARKSRGGRHSPVGLISYEFCGIIYKMHEASESLFIREVSAIAFEGVGQA
jgi:hypothetical protein